MQKGASLFLGVLCVFAGGWTRLVGRRSGSMPLTNSVIASRLFAYTATPRSTTNKFGAVTHAWLHPPLPISPPSLLAASSPQSPLHDIARPTPYGEWVSAPLRLLAAVASREKGVYSSAVPTRYSLLAS